MEDNGVKASDREDVLRQARTAGYLPGYPAGRGLAAFASAGGTVVLRLAVRLPEIAAIGRRCLVAPLLATLWAARRVVLLELTTEGMRLHEVKHSSVAAIPLTGLPFGPLAASSGQRSAPVSAIVPGMSSSGAALHKGDGAQDLAYAHLREIDQAIRATLTSDRALLILAAERRIADMYREVSTYPFLLVEGVEGPLHGMTDAEIHGRAWGIAEPVLAQPAIEAAARFRAMAGTSRTVTDPEAIFDAARRGRVEVLFLSTASSAWRRPDGSNLILLDDEGNSTARLNAAVIHAVQGGGTAYALPPDYLPPAPEGVAAILRN
jgi:hypothetical protein